MAAVARIAEPVDAAPPQAENLRILGRMSAGVCHDLRNVLNTMALHVQFLQRMQTIGADEGRRELAILRRDIAFGAQILDRLCSFGSAHARKQVARVALADVAHDACEIERVFLGRAHAVELSEAYLPAPQVVVGAPEVMSAVVNLLINAVDAAATRIEVRTGAGGGGAWIEVADDGLGVSPELVERIFEPFYTTKGARGTGLGLTEVRSCVRSYGGSIAVHSQLGAGTTFTLWFPVGIERD